MAARGVACKGMTGVTCTAMPSGLSWWTEAQDGNAQSNYDREFVHIRTSVFAWLCGGRGARPSAPRPSACFG
ncbi:MAG TPA: hypothetical protein VJT50_11270 [Pyrinomonadaceae bacterium]|nr:hypothetical protein [Pyrinomonadaceae bacterium]